MCHVYYTCSSCVSHTCNVAATCVSRVQYTCITQENTHAMQLQHTATHCSTCSHMHVEVLRMGGGRGGALTRDGRGRGGGAPTRTRGCSSNVSRVTCHMSSVSCHMSSVTCQVSHVICHMSHVTCHMSHVTRSIRTALGACHVMRDAKRRVNETQVVNW